MLVDDQTGLVVEWDVEADHIAPATQIIDAHAPTTDGESCQARSTVSHGSNPSHAAQADGRIGHLHPNSAEAQNSEFLSLELENHQSASSPFPLVLNAASSPLEATGVIPGRSNIAGGESMPQW